MDGTAQNNGASTPKPKRVVGRPFPKGVSGNPGGRPRSTRVYLEEAMNAVPLHRWRKVVLRALRDAEKGNKDARVWLAKVFGLEKLEIGVTASENPEALRLALLHPRELVGEYQKALDALGGPAASSSTNGTQPHA